VLGLYPVEPLLLVGHIVLDQQKGPTREQASTASVPEAPFRYLESYTLEDLLVESVDEVLRDLLGTKVREAIYDYLERNYKIARDLVPRNLVTFFTVLDEICGKSSRIIGKAIASRLFTKLGWKFVEVKGFEFVDYLEEARARIARELIQRAKSAKPTGPDLC
jgi:hypothetical protein